MKTMHTTLSKTLRLLAILLALGVTAVPFTACQQDDSLGDKIEDAADNAGDAVEDAGDEIEDALDENSGPADTLGEKLEEGLEETGDALEEGAEKTKEMAQKAREEMGGGGAGSSR